MKISRIEVEKMKLGPGQARPYDATRHEMVTHGNEEEFGLEISGDIVRIKSIAIITNSYYYTKSKTNI